ncbi:Cell wall-active antibiotics response 4TMS YvqF [Thermomonospora echinospora]|uniref:Cell wall-active antibiotics response 4TMS YvqF n=2 Tax=Thermomonospora echinospora TaxID=1992 RepID=A0A1H5SM95_9ACTN|nr:Cell wall-active antibiotics response 4TMS YvqF [Thermomonospora echinospora]
MRASDADRDRVADRLREALAEGRLTPAEHAERIDAVYEARTYAELAPLVADLPDAGEPIGPLPDPQPQPRVRLDKEPSLPAPRRESTSIVAVFGGADRRGRWLVEPDTSVLAAFGGVDLDFRQAVLSRREVHLTVTCLFGGVTLKVPPGVRVINSISAVFGGVSTPEDDAFDADAPVIRLSGVALFGGVDVKRK